MKTQVFYKIALVVAYCITAAVLFNTYQAGMLADQTGKSGTDFSWFGDKWMFVLGVLVVAIIALHVGSRMRMKQETAIKK